LRHGQERVDLQEAFYLFASLLPDYEHVMGPDHSSTLNIIVIFGGLTVCTGKHAEGCRMLLKGLSRSEARFGPTHQMTRKFRNAIQELGCSDA
jgi:hypothetical protein